VKNLAIKNVYDLKSPRLNEEFVPLIMQVRMAIIQGLDQEFLSDNDVAPLEVTSAQFAILKNVLKGKATAACELCKFMDYDRGAMSRLIGWKERGSFGASRLPIPAGRGLLKSPRRAERHFRKCKPVLRVWSIAC